MNMGLLWFDDDPKKPQAHKISEAAERYWQRFAVTPTACHICRPVGGRPAETPAQRDDGQRLDLSLPSSPGEAPRMLSLAVVPNGSIGPNHFWVGVDDAPRRG